MCLANDEIQRNSFDDNCFVLYYINFSAMKKFVRKFWEGWKRAAHAFGRLQTRMIITVFYFLILSPIGGVMRLFGWNPLQVRLSNHKRPTNWQPVKENEPDLDSLRRQS